MTKFKKQLRNNFTTPEQSKRLLELGVPADSADCCLRRILTDGGYCETWRVDVFNFIGQIHDDYLPCWSVGRLMEIFEICDVQPAGTENNMCSIPSLKRMSYMEYMMKCFTKAIEIEILDFSKLED